MALTAGLLAAVLTQGASAQGAAATGEAPGGAGAPQAVTAPAPAAEPTPEQQNAAREAYARGQKAFTEGRFQDARAAFGEAFAAVPNPVVLLPIAESEAALGDYAAARRSLRHYLELRADAPDRAEVEQKLAELEARPGRVAVDSVPAGARLRVDGADRSETTPAELELAVGEHRIELALPGHEPAVATVEVEPGALGSVRVELTPQAAAPPPTAAAEPEVPLQSEPAQGPSKAALWTCGVLGATGIITGTVLGFLALDEHAQFEKAPSVSSADRGEKLALFADVSFAVGAMALITGAVLLLTAGDDTPDDAANPPEGAPSVRLKLTPHVAPGTVAASARVTF